MMRVRRAACGAAAWAALAGVGLLSGCASSDPCGRPSLMSRLGCRPRATEMTYQGPMTAPAVPVSSGAFTGVPFTGEFPMTTPGCCDGPVLPPSSDPFYSGSPDTFPGSSLMPHNGMMGAPITLPPGASLPPGAVPVPNGSFGAPPSMLPAPTPEAGPPRLSPVPNGSFAQPTPANPSSRKRW